MLGLIFAAIEPFVAEIGRHEIDTSAPLQQVVARVLQIVGIETEG